MKKISFLMAIVCMTFFTACTEVNLSSLDNFDTSNCIFGLNSYLLPSKDFITKYDYIAGDYQYIDRGDLAWGFATTFVYLQYSPDVYIEAKNDCIDNFVLGSEQQHEYNGFYFSENLTLFTQLADGAGRNNYKYDCYKQPFNMFGFNDERCTIVFLGYYNGNPQDQVSELVSDDFGSFISKYFSDYYDWVDNDYAY